MGESGEREVASESETGEGSSEVAASRRAVPTFVPRKRHVSEVLNSKLNNDLVSLLGVYR